MKITMIYVGEYIIFVLSYCTAVLGYQRITCESKKHAYKACSLNDHYNTIVKSEQLSGSPCEIGVSFGLNGNIIWVSKGCRATFIVSNTETTTSTTTPNPITTTSVAQTTTGKYIATTFVIESTSDEHTTAPTISTSINNATGFRTCDCTATCIKDLRKKLAINKALLSSVIRKRTSASDQRTSSAIIGYSAVTFLVMVGLFFVILDLITL